MKRFGSALKVVVGTCVLASPIYGYVTSRELSSTNMVVQRKWATGPIPWQMNPSAGQNISGSREFGQVVQQSFRTWSSLPTANIIFAEGSPTTAKHTYDGNNVVVANLTTAEWAALGLGPGVLAFTAVNSSDGGTVLDRLGRPVAFPGQIADADIVFNPSYQFSTDETVPPSRVDFQSVLTHEIGHLLGLDHSPIMSATMFWAATEGISLPRKLSPDDIAGVSTIYPNALFLSKATLQGTVRTTANAPVFGAVVIALDGIGQPVASAITDPNGQYSIMGLDSGMYTVYAQPLDGFTDSSDFHTLQRIYPEGNVSSGFTGRFR